MKIKLALDTDAVRQALAIERGAVTSATRSTLNRTAERARDDIRTEMGRVFDRPTPYTLNSMMIDYARRDRLEAQVRFKDGLGNKNRSPERWVGVQVRGGAREQKAAERRISWRRGNQPVFLVPTRFAEIDSYGNINRGQLTKILSEINALDDGNNKRDRVGKARGRRRREEYFAVFRSVPGLKPGIYQRRRTGFGNGVVPIYFFARKAPQYRQRLDFDGVARQSVERNLQAIWQDELAARRGG